MTKRRNLRHWALASVAAVIAPCSAAHALGADNQIEEIIVTAEKREANLQSVPMSISAVTAQRIEAVGATTARDLVTLTPGLVFTKSVGNGIPFMRGVGQTIGDISGESPVAVYVNGVYLMHPASGLFSLASIERVEVLKGPQGTLFGRNAVGGVIHLITKTPSLSEAEGSIEIGYGSYSTAKLSGYGSAPLGDTLATNLAFTYQNRDKGYIRTPIVGRREGESESYSLANKWRWTPSEDTTVTLDLIADHSRDNIGARFGTPKGSRPNTGGSNYISFWTIPSVSPFTGDRSNEIASLTVEHDLGWGRVKNVTAYNRLDMRVFLETFTAGLGTTANAPIFTDIKESGDTITNELQIQAPSDSDFQWIAGVYFLHDVARDTRLGWNTLANRLAGSPLTLKQGAQQQTTSYAAFAQATKTVLPDTRLTVGARYTYDKKEVEGRAIIGAFPTYEAGLTAVAASPKADWSKFTPRISLDHDFTPDVLGYIAVSKGFKSGVYNLGSFNNPPVNPETVKLYEVGLKSELFDKRLRLNVSLFRQDYANIQLRTGTILICGPGGCAPGTLLSNAAESRMQGADVDFEIAVAPGLSLFGGFEYLDAEFRKFPVAGCSTPRPAPAGGNVTVNCDLGGARMPRSPRFTGNLAVNYSHELAGGGEVGFTLNDAYNSGFGWDPDGRLRQKAYHLASGSVRWTSPNEAWTARIWGRNLFNAKIMANAAASGSDIYFPDEPFTFGASIERKF